jgi:hypothetical protein
MTLVLKIYGDAAPTNDNLVKQLAMSIINRMVENNPLPTKEIREVLIRWTRTI